MTVSFSLPVAQDRMVNSGDLSAQMVTALLGSDILVGKTLSTSALLVSSSRKSGLNLSAQVDGVMVTAGCFGGSVSFMMESSSSFLLFGSFAGRGDGGGDISGCDGGGVGGYWGCCIVVGLVADGNCSKNK